MQIFGSLLLFEAKAQVSFNKNRKFEIIITTKLTEKKTVNNFVKNISLT
jgi:hypothetical protein